MRAMKAVAKCANYSGCLVAHKGTAIELVDGQPAVCPECGRPLSTTHAQPPARMKTVATIAVLAALMIGGVAALREMSKTRRVTEGAAIAAANDLETRPPAVDSGPDTAPDPVAPAAAPGPAADAPVAVLRADNSKVTDEVRAEVLKRIDAMPIAPGKKDKLYTSVLRAKEMRRIIVVPFASGGRTLPTREGAELKTLLSTPEIIKVREDLTAVFIVLGFADSKGDEKANLAISADRAKHVKEFLVGPCGVKNITHDVAMGGSKLVDEQRFEKNRIVEVWTVLP